MRKLTLFITSLFLGIGMAWAQTVPSGSLVTFTNVQKDGTEYVLHIDDSGVLAVGEAGKAASEYGDAAKFKAELQADGKYSFYNEAKDLYMIWEGNTKNPGYNSNKGVLDTYNSTYCDWTLGDGSASKSGTYYLNSKRKDGTTDGTLTILSNGVFDAYSKSVAWANGYSNLFRIDFVEEDVTVELKDTESGITFGGTYRGFRNITEPTLGWGCQLSNQVWNGNTLTADIQLPFAINEETMIAIHEPELLHRLYVDGENIRVDKTPFEYSNINDWIWKIHPVMTGNVVTFTIEHVATGKYAKAGDTNQHYVEGTVTLVEKGSCNTFEIANYGSYPSFKVCGKDSYLSINTDRDESVALGLHGNTHNGSRIHFAPVPVATIGGVEYTTLAEALTAASAMSGDITVELYDKVTLNSSLSGNYSSIKFVGKDTDAEIYLDVQGYITATGKKVAFEDLTLSKSAGGFIGNAGFMNVAFGIYDVTEVTYTDCTFANGAYASSGTVTFNGCTFYRSHDKYGLWAYGNVETTVEGCTFADYRGIKMYAEGAAKTVDLTVKDTDFSAVTDKPAIVLTYGESVTLEGNTYSSTGTFELDLDGAPAGTPVTSDVAPVCVNDNGACGVLVDGKIYTTVAEAVAVATEGSNVTLLHSTTDAAEFAEGVNLTLADGVTAENVTVAVSAVAQIGETKYADLQEAIKAAVPDGTVELLSDVTVDKWTMFTQSLTIGTGQLNTVDKIDGLTIDGKGYSLTIKSIESASNGNRLFFDADNLNVKNLIINYVDDAASQGGIGLTAGTFENVIFNGGGNAILPGTGDITVTGCTFKTNGTSIYYEEERDNLVVTGNTFENPDNVNVILLRGNTVFTENNVISGRTVNVVSGSPVVTGNNFNDVRFKVYNVATATVENNEINNLVFNDESVVYSTFNSNTLSEEAQAVLDAATFLAPVAKIGDVEYTSLQEALNAAAAGTGNVTVTILDDVNLAGVTWTPVTVSAPGYPVVTVEGNSKTITGLTDMLFAGTWAGGSGLIIKDLTIENSAIVNDKDDAKGTVGVGAFIGFPQASAVITLDNCHLVNSSVEGGHWTGGLIGYAAGYAGTDGPVFMDLTITNCSVRGSTITGKGSAGGIIGHGSGNAWTNVVIENTTVSGNTVTSTGSSTNKAGAVMGTIGAAGQPTTVNGVTKTGGMSVSAAVSDNTVTSAGTTITTIYGRQGTATGLLAVAGGSYDNYPIEEGVAYAAPAAGYKIEENADGTYGVVVDPAYGAVAKIGDDAYFGTLQAALDAATDGQTVTLLTGITLTDADMVKIEGKYNVMMNVSGKDITLDLNEQTINIDYNGGQYLYAAVFVADGAGLTVTGNGKIDIAENGINVAYMFWKRGTTGHLTIENGTFHMDDSADSMVYTNGSEIVTVNGGTFTLDAVGTRENGFPCVFSAYGQNTANIIVNGGTFNADVNHQYWAHEVNVSETLALKDNGNGTWTVVPAVAYAVEMSSGYNRHVGYTTLEEAIAAAEAVVLLSDIETTDGYSIANGKKLTLDLNGKTIAATDNTSKNYGAIDNRGDLTITDSSEEQTGKITVIATVNSGWNRYSAVIANNPGGKLTVNGGTLEHLGGTDMAYGIDNLTNGKGTYAETIINGGVVKSPYRGIRQFLNGIEAQNILTINGGTIEGANKSVWMQDPSKNANTGTLTVGENASLIGDVYLFVTAGSTEWPVEVSIAAAALTDGAQVVTGNVPANWAVSNVNGTWGKVAAVATTGGVGYPSVTEAINAAEDGAIVEILAGTISEYIAPWAGNSKHDTEKSITIVGAADFGTVLTGGMYLGYDDSQCREHNITVKGIHFTGKGLTVACQQNVTIEDNKFTDIEGRAIAVIGKNINSMVNNNVIENTTSVGIELRNTLTATVEGNTITGTGHNALQITSQVGATESTATVKNNMMSDWGVGGEGRAMRFEGIVTATVNGNVMSHTAAPEEFAKITNSTTLDASQNYWNGVSPLTAGIFTGVEGDPAVVLKSYYTDAEKTTLVEFSAAGSAARIGSVYFATLADAVAAAQANDVITFLTDIDESVTISKSVTIDGGDNDYTGTMTINTSLNVTVQNVNFVKGCITEANGSHGYLTVKDCDFDGVDKSIGYAISVRGGDKVTIENSTAKNYYYGMLYVPRSVATINVKDVTVEDVAAAFNISYSGNGTFENVTLNNVTYGLHVQNYGARTFTLTNWNVTGSEYPIYVQEKSTANVTFAFEEVNDFGLTADKLIFSEYAIVKAEAVVGTKIYGSFLTALDAAQAGETVTLLTDITLAGGYEDAEEALRIEKAVTINGAGYTIDCGNLRKGIRVYYNGTDYARVRFENVTIKNDAAQGRCIDTRTGHITLELANSTLIAEGTNSQPLTIGGSEPAYRVDLLGTTIKAGKSGYGVICFVPVQAGINAASNTVIEGLAAFYFKSDAGNTRLNLGHGTYTGTNLNPVESGSFGTVVVEGENNTITMNIDLATIKAIAGDGAAQAAFNVRGAGNTIQITAKGAQVITEGAQAYRAMVKSDVAASTKLVDNGTELSLVAESNGVQFYSFEEAVRFAGNEGTVKLVNDVVLDNTWSVAAGQDITLDLNGKTLGANIAEQLTKSFAVIQNRGTLTVKDETGNGKVTVSYGGASFGYGMGLYTISNEGGVLNIEGGTIENTTSVDGSMYDAIDNNSTLGETVLNISGGEVVCAKYIGVRQFANNVNYDNIVNVTGGKVVGGNTSIWMQNPGSNQPKATIAISGADYENGNYPVIEGRLLAGESTGFTFAVTGGLFDTDVNAFCAADYATYNFGDGTWGIEPTVIDEITLVDGEFTEFTNQNDKLVGTLTYERNFSTVWYPLYVPFEIPVSQLADQFEVAYINGVRRDDVDGDGILDKFVMEVIYIHGGNADGSGKTLKANYPYFIRSKTGQSERLSLVLEDALLYAAENVTYDCSTMTEKFEITGNASQITLNSSVAPTYTVSTKGEWSKRTQDSDLKPFRFYMTVTDRDGNAPTIADVPVTMSISVRGEEREDGTTFIYDVEMDGEQATDYIYDLQGRRVLEPQKGSLYIINGKKVIF